MTDEKSQENGKIEYAQLEQMLDDIDVTDAEIADYLQLNIDRSDAFSPEVEVNWDRVHRPKDDALEGAIAVGFLNNASRRRRRRKYRRKIDGGFNGIKIVSEGDSWFQYPFLLKDVVDHLSERPEFAIRSLGAAGDLLKDMIENGEFAEEVKQENPEAFLISGGGNDLVGDMRLQTMVQEFDPGLDPVEYPNDAFAAFEYEIESLYTGMFESISAQFPALRVFCHGYDYAIPDNGKWLGKPLKRRAIRNQELQANIVRNIMDRFNARLAAVAEQFAAVSYVDCRNAVTNWHDELHPKSPDYGIVAERFAQAILER